MKRLTLIFATFLCFISAYAEDSIYENLYIVKSDGSETELPASGLELTFSEGIMTAKSSEGTTEFNITDLKGLSFQVSTSATAEISLDTPVTVWDTAGVLKGEYSTLKAACDSLSKGIYIVRTQDGNNLKIELK